MQINYQFHWIAKGCRPTDEEVESAMRTVEGMIKEELRQGSFINYPRVCYFISSPDDIETLWPHILTYTEQQTGRRRYAGTTTLDLSLKLKQQKEELHDSFEAHREWYEESLKKFKEKLKRHKSLLNGSHFNDRYGIAPTIGNLKRWLFERYGPKMKLHMKFTEDKETGITWINDFNFDFPDITKAFEREVREEDLHIFCREIVDRQREIENKLQSSNQDLLLNANDSNKNNGLSLVDSNLTAKREATENRDSQLSKRYHQLKGEGLEWAIIINRLTRESGDFGISNAKLESAKTQIRRILRSQGITNKK